MTSWVGDPRRNPFPTRAAARIAGPDDSQPADPTVETDAVRRASAHLSAYLAAEPSGSEPDRAGQVIAVLGDHGSGRTHLVDGLVRQARRILNDAAQAIYLEATSDDLVELHRRFVARLGLAGVRAQVGGYYADVVAESLQRREFDGRVIDGLRTGEVAPHDVVERLGLMESALLREVRDRLRRIVGDNESCTALMLLLRQGFDDSVWAWLTGAPPDVVLRERGITTRIETAAAAVDAMCALARCFGGRRGRFLLVIDDLDRVLSAGRPRHAELTELQALFEVFPKAGACLVVSGLPELPATLGPNTWSLVSHNVELGGLSAEEVGLLIRLTQRAGIGSDEFEPLTSEAVHYLTQLAGGVPRNVIRLCHDAYQLVEDRERETGAGSLAVTPGVIHDVAGRVLGWGGADDVLDAVTRVLDANGWSYSTDSSLGAGPGSVAEFWITFDDRAGGCAVLVTGSVVNAADANTVAGRILAARATVPDAQVILVVDGVVAQPYADRVGESLGARPLVRAGHGFAGDLARLVRAARNRLTSSALDSPLSVVSSGRQIDHLTDLERGLWAQFPQGGHVDLRTGDPSGDDLAEASNWGPERIVRAEVIAALLTGARRVEQWQSPALALSGARVSGVLDLRGQHFRHEVLLHGCYFDEPLLLEETTCTSLRLSGCRLPGIRAPWLVSSGRVHLRDCEVDGQVDLTGAHIGQQFMLGRSRVSNPGGVAVLADGLVVDGDCLCHDADIDGQFSLLAARIGGQLGFTDSRLSNEDGIALLADRITVQKDVYCREGFTALGEVRLVGAHIGGQLSFSHGHVANPGGVALAADQLVVDQHLYCHEGFTAEGEITLVAARVGGEVRFSTAELTNPGGTALHADRLTVGADLYCRNGLKVTGKVSLKEAQVGGQLNFNQAMLDNPGEVALDCDEIVIGGHLYCLDGFHVTGEVQLTAARVGGEVRFSSSAFTNPGGMALRADRLTVEKDLYGRNGLIVDGEVSLHGAHVGGQLNFNHSTLRNPGKVALDADHLVVGEHLYCHENFLAEGEISLVAARIGGEVRFSAARLHNPGGTALQAERLVVGSSMFCRPGVKVDGAIRLSGADIAGQLSLSGAQLVGAEGAALRAGRLSVGSHLICDDGFAAVGMIDLCDANIGGEFNLNTARLDAHDPGGAVALWAGWLTVGADISCRDGFSATGSMLLTGAHIGGHLSLTGASIVADGGVALDATGIKVTEDLSCNEGFRTKGAVCLRGAHIGKNLDFRNARLEGPGGYALDAEDLQADRMLMPKEVVAGVIVLRNATLVEFDDKCEVLGGFIDVTGLSYETLIAPLDPALRLRWLERSEEWEGQVDPQPYEQMARSYRRLGYDNHARTILLAKERRLHAKERTTRLNWLWGIVQDKTIHYGYNPARAGIGFVALLLLGTLIFGIDPPQPFSELSGARFNPFLYTLDLLIPIADFGQRQLWNPNTAQQWIGSIITVLGWTLASITIIGLIRRAQSTLTRS